MLWCIIVRNSYVECTVCSAVTVAVTLVPDKKKK